MTPEQTDAELEPAYPLGLHVLLHVARSFGLKNGRLYCIDPGKVRASSSFEPSGLIYHYIRRCSALDLYQRFIDKGGDPLPFLPAFRKAMSGIGYRDDMLDIFESELAALKDQRQITALKERLVESAAATWAKMQPSS